MGTGKALTRRRRRLLLGPARDGSPAEECLPLQFRRNWSALIEEQRSGVYAARRHIVEAWALSAHTLGRPGEAAAWAEVHRDAALVPGSGCPDMWGGTPWRAGVKMEDVAGIDSVKGDIEVALEMLLGAKAYRAVGARPFKARAARPPPPPRAAP